ncbi:helix-turn-helix domain-containing protein [uncultured Anaerovibrio sp.]|uniref:helix-turn-helix domain-containing protein n=1 Tax=uncultured Anaerovibrio sp. TaxID=361586 RepID=UPI0025D766BB|nr:helix-turn-helix domain-containing protein [uncultured Anaerovibrio sp.]
MNNEPVRILSLEELCEQLTIGRNAAYNLLRTGQIKAFRIKRIWKIPQSSINEYVQAVTK